MQVRGTSYLTFKQNGLKGFLSHIAIRIFGEARYLRPASTIDFRHSNLIPSTTLIEFIQTLIPNKSILDIEKAVANSISMLSEVSLASDIKSIYPERWNSGKHLQFFLCALVQLVKPSCVVEIGTANGASAAAIAAGLELNNFGHLWSFDINENVGSLVNSKLKNRVTFIKVDGTKLVLENHLKSITTEIGNSIFLHDGDHSYIGQMNDYLIAQKFNFNYIISDDIDASLAFCDFAKNKGKVYFDAPKFIGSYLNSEIG